MLMAFRRFLRYEQLNMGEYYEAMYKQYLSNINTYMAGGAAARSGDGLKFVRAELGLVQGPWIGRRNGKGSVEVIVT